MIYRVPMAALIRADSKETAYDGLFQTLREMREDGEFDEQIELVIGPREQVEEWRDD